ncbi:helix-turn-helix domain-containing protein [Sphingomonas sp. SFZ2018-12]|uniref:helix-turn-helix transcriptional regulator n=1 Tax=Sphingomonas sp. SFZ2018-12 TaxID=2683197 RepID=UPI0008317EAA|nr:AraC family transcriptional regulator [Sphingomonas sp. SFZ2018-12]MCH4893921.1 helix-turn-helix domain-containing protein [Sphingomonas sp. SFZ2018-12]
MPLLIPPPTAPVHHHVIQPLVVGRAGRKDIAPRVDGRIERRPDFGLQIETPGVRLHELESEVFDFSFQARAHVIDFNFNPGWSMMKVNDGPLRRLEFDRHAVSFAPSGSELVRHATASNAVSGTHRTIAVAIEPDWMATLVADVADGRAVHFASHADPAPWPVMQRVQSALAAFFRAPGHFSTVTVEAVVNEIALRTLLRWSNLSTRMATIAVRSEDPAVARAIAFIHANLRAPVTLADIHAAAGRDGTLLAGPFRRVTGLTVYTYLVRARIDAAAEDLRATSMPVAEIARRYQFGSPAHFSTSFRNVIGVSPRRYRGEIAAG